MRVWRWPVRLLGGMACAVALYWVVAAAAMFVPINRNFQQTPEGVDIFLSSNGIHVDLVVPVTTGVMDWRRLGIVTRRETAWLAFGWGERDFFLQTATWSDFRLTTGVNSLLWRDTLMHVTELAAPKASVRKVVISEAQYRRLVRSIQAGFAPGQPRRLSGKGYGDNDNFYYGAGAYSAFMTCNQWTNRALADAGVRAALWSPLPWGVMRR